MQIYIYNKDNHIFEYSKIAQKSPLENNKFIFPPNSTTVAPPAYNEFERPYFIDGKWIIKPYFVGEYQVEISSLSVSLINYEGNIKPGFLHITKTIAKDLYKNQLQYIIENNKLIKLSDEEFSIKKQILEIENQIMQANIDYENYINTPVLYTNGFTYKPNYAKDSYEPLLNAEKFAKEIGQTTFPQYIKDSTKLAEHAVIMTYNELLSLSFFLAEHQSRAWQIKAQAEAELLQKREDLLKNGNIRIR